MLVFFFFFSFFLKKKAQYQYAEIKKFEQISRPHGGTIRISVNKNILVSVLTLASAVNHLCQNGQITTAY